MITRLFTHFHFHEIWADLLTSQQVSERVFIEGETITDELKASSDNNLFIQTL